MGQRGPAKVPTDLLRKRGSWLAKKRGDEPKAKRGRPPCPRWLSPEARKVWKLLVPVLEKMGILATCDRNVLTRYCEAFVAWRECVEWIAKNGDVYPEKDAQGRVVAIREYPQVARATKLSEHLLRIEKQFGLTPSARADLAIPRDDPDENRGRKERFFAQPRTPYQL